jgi:hypothetical protein
MAYEINLYCSTNGLSAAKGLDAILSQATADGVELQVSSRSSGENWDAAEFDLAADTPGTSGCLIQFQSASPLVEAAVAEVAPEDLSGQVRFADAIVTLTLSGDGCRSVVKAVWAAARSMWDVVPYDDGSGFDVDLDEL